MKHVHYIYLSIIALLAGYTVFLRSCGTGNNEPQPLDTLSNNVTLVYDGKIYGQEIKQVDSVPYPIYVIGTDTIPFPVHDTITIIDTPSVVFAWLRTRVYTEHNYLDSNISMCINDSVYQNEITYRNIKYQLLRPVSITNTTVVAPAKRRGVYLGAYVNQNVPGALVMYNYDKWLFGAGYSTNNTLHTQILFKLW